MYGVSPANCRRRRLRKPKVQNLALRDQIGDRASRLLDRSVLVYAVLVVEVDVIGAKTPERTLYRCLDIRRGTVDGAGSTSPVRDEPKLCGDDYGGASPCDG